MFTITEMVRFLKLLLPPTLNQILKSTMEILSGQGNIFQGMAPAILLDHPTRVRFTNFQFRPGTETALSPHLLQMSGEDGLLTSILTTQFPTIWWSGYRTTIKYSDCSST